MKWAWSEFTYTGGVLFANMLSAIGLIGAGDRLLTNVSRRFPNRAADTLSLRALFAEKSGDLEHAENLLTQAISFDRSIAFLYFERGMLREKLGKMNAALGDLESAESLGHDFDELFMAKLRAEIARLRQGSAEV